MSFLSIFIVSYFTPNLLITCLEFSPGIWFERWIHHFFLNGYPLVSVVIVSRPVFILPIEDATFIIYSVFVYIWIYAVFAVINCALVEERNSIVVLRRHPSWRKKKEASLLTDTGQRP